MAFSTGCDCVPRAIAFIWQHWRTRPTIGAIADAASGRIGEWISAHQ
jgi:hypothetical protein